MNNLNFLRLVSKAQINSINHIKYSRILQQLAKRPMSTSVPVEKQNEKQVFLDALPGIIDTLVNSPKMSQLPEVGSWLKKLTQHTVIGGKNARGLMTTYAYEMMEKTENITEENIKLARVLGWCIEIAQAYFCVLDDIMDESTMRRGAPCWYLMPNVGMGALNDSVLLSSSIMEILELYFAETPYYTDLVKLFHETILYTCMGQHIDFTTAHHTKHDYSLFTIDRYDTIVRYKTSFYTFRLPALLGLTLVKDVDKRMFAGIDDISFLLGSLFQMQDDYIDCYGDEALTGKAGTDIQEGKCTWLSVHALKLANEEQRALFTKYYGSKEPEHVAHIKNLYGDLHLQELYKQRELEIYNDIVSRVNALPLDTAPSYFFKILGQTYKRNR